jgi:hypothetical protein
MLDLSSLAKRTQQMCLLYNQVLIQCAKAKSTLNLKPNCCTSTAEPHTKACCKPRNAHDTACDAVKQPKQSTQGHRNCGLHPFSSRGTPQDFASRVSLGCRPPAALKYSPSRHPAAHQLWTAPDRTEEIYLAASAFLRAKTGLSAGGVSTGVSPVAFTRA